MLGGEEATPLRPPASAGLPQPLTGDQDDKNKNTMILNDQRTQTERQPGSQVLDRIL